MLVRNLKLFSLVQFQNLSFEGKGLDKSRTLNSHYKTFLHNLNISKKTYYNENVMSHSPFKTSHSSITGKGGKMKKRQI